MFSHDSSGHFEASLNSDTTELHDSPLIYYEQIIVRTICRNFVNAACIKPQLNTL